MSFLKWKIFYFCISKFFFLQTHNNYFRLSALSIIEFSQLFYRFSVFPFLFSKMLILCAFYFSYFSAHSLIHFFLLTLPPLLLQYLHFICFFIGRLFEQHGYVFIDPETYTQTRRSVGT